MTVKTKIKKKGAVPGNLPRREYNREIQQPALESVGIEFHRKFMHIRFTERAKRLLRYTPRKRSYQAAKRRSKGHNDPLVWTGESRGIARLRDVRATSKRTRVKVHAKKLNFRHPNSQINMADEVTRVADSEFRYLTEHMAKEVEANLGKYRKQTTTKVS